MMARPITFAMLPAERSSIAIAVDIVLHLKANPPTRLMLGWTMTAQGRLHWAICELSPVEVEADAAAAIMHGAREIAARIMGRAR